MKKLVSISVALFTLLAFVGYAYADSIGIYPPVIEIKAKEGAQVESPITLVNGGSEPVNVEIDLKGFDIKDNTLATVLFYPDSKTPDNLSSFLDSVQILDEGTPVTSLNLSPNESKTLTLSFPVLSSKSEEYYFSVVFQSQPKSNAASDSNTVASTSAGIASLIFISLNEKEHLTPSIDTFSTNTFHSSSPIQFELKAANTGNHFKNVSGVITLYNMLGKKTGEIKIPPQIITANNSRELRMKGNEQISWTSGFPFGIYTAKAVLSYENAPTVTKEKRFVVLPLLTLLILIGLLFFILGVFLRVIRKVNLKEK